MRAIAAHQITFAANIDGREVTVTAGISAFHPGKMYGPPETCFPSEGGEPEIISVVDNETGKKVELASHQVEDLEEIAIQKESERNY